MMGPCHINVLLLCQFYSLITPIQVRAEPLLLFANRKDVRLMDVEHPRQNSTAIIESVEEPAAVDFFFKQQAVFWTDVGLEMIKMTYRNGSGTVTVIDSGLEAPDGLACDWLGLKLYWSDSGASTKRIEVANLDGSYRKVLFWQRLDQPRAIALDPPNGYIYWTDWGEVPKIERAGMDGNMATRSVIVRDNIFWPNGLTLDHQAQRVYWADAKLSFIHSCNYDGTDRKVVVEGALPHPFALTLFGDTLFWTDWETKSIHSCDKNTGQNARVVKSNIFSPMDIHAYSAERQPDGQNPCGRDNGGCSHLCLMSPLPPYRTCACPTGVRLTDDQKTCADGASELLLLARRMDLRRISLDTRDYTSVVLPMQHIKHAIAIDYDPVDRMVYWSDDEVRKIWRANLDGTGQEIVIQREVQHPDGLAVDWIARNLYWTDTGTDRIEVARLNGTSRRVLISERLRQPRAIALDPVAGLMFWSDWGKVPKIERAALDGTQRTVLIDTQLGWPNGLAIDYESRMVYWGDAHTDKIEACDMNGGRRRVLVSDQLPHIFGFSLLGDYLYWTDWQRRSIERVNKRTGGEREIIIEQLPDLMGLKAINVKQIRGTNACARRNGECSHLCLNTPSGHVCACPMGQALLNDQQTCIVPEAFILFTQNADIRRISLETNRYDVSIPLAGVKKASALDFDINDERIYWTDTAKESISRAFMNGSSLEHVIEFGLEYPEGMAVDWLARNLYWADTGTNRIEMARLDGTSRRVLIWKDLVSPRALALDPPEGHMYWSDWSQEPRIHRAGLDGQNRQVLIGANGELGRVNALTIDYIGRRLFWADLGSGSIHSSKLDGSDRRLLASDLPRPMGLTQYRNYIYWTDAATQAIERINKTNGANRTLIQGHLDFVMHIMVFHSSRQSGWNSCAVLNGLCEHLCVAHTNGTNGTSSHHCTCPTHYSLDSNNSTCSAPSKFLLYSQRNQITRFLVDHDSSPELVLPITGLRNIRSLVFDPVERYAYWLDGRTNAIKRAKDNGTQSEVVLANHRNIFLPHAIALDPYSRNIYWTCSQNNVINVTRLDGSAVGVVLSGPNQRPRALVLHPLQGLMFWVNDGPSPSIDRSTMDGQDVLSIVLGDLGRPTSLALDARRQRLYWADSELNRIELSDLSGESRRVLVDEQIINPVGIAVIDDYIYWIDRTQQLIERVHKETGLERVQIKLRVPALSSIVSTEPIAKADLKAHPCYPNVACSHVCVSRPDASYCACPRNLVLGTNRLHCTAPPTCGPKMFTCRTGNIGCIPLLWRCDGLAECEDSSDEQDCPVCGADQFQCRNGQCVPLSEKCNSHPACSDASDEDQCCSQNFFQCKNYQCIDKSQHCDGQYDCADTTDELMCCGLRQFKCANFQCISSDKWCNGVPDCDDHSDERNCPPNPLTGSRHTSVSSTNPAPYVVAIVVAFFVIIVIIALFVYTYHKKGYEESENFMLSEHLNPAESRVATVRGKDGDHIYMFVSTALSTTSYNRGHITGASSSSSSLVPYPKETLNPPPSPVTDRSNNVDVYSSTSSSLRAASRPEVKVRAGVRRGKRRVQLVPPPPTTPCSTDVCDESEPSYRRPSRHKRRRRAYELYAAEPYPPPPTPRSQYHSDGISCPPSPSTERSFFNPYPPPPSPVGTCHSLSPPLSLAPN